MSVTMQYQLYQEECRDESYPMKDVTGPASITVLHNTTQLRCYTDQLEELSENAIEPNVFYEPWMLLPAHDYYAGNSQCVFILVFENILENGHEVRYLCGFFPMEDRAWYRGLPLRNLTLWRYPHCYFSTPFLRKGFVNQTLERFTAWLKKQQGYKILEFPQIAAHGLFHAGLERIFQRDSDLIYTDNVYERALLCARKDADAYLQESFSRKSRKKHRRLQRRLSEYATLSWDELRVESDLDSWIDDFLRLEAAGWKGSSGTALMMTEEDRQFFSIISEAAFRRQRLIMLALILDNKTVAMISVLLSSDGGYAFKMAYDEDYRRFSLGTLLALELTRRLHSRPGFRWLDSCADPGNYFANHLWKDRKIMSKLTISNRNLIGNGIVRMLPKMKKLKKYFSD